MITVEFPLEDGGVKTSVIGADYRDTRVEHQYSEPQVNPRESLWREKLLVLILKDWFKFFLSPSGREHTNSLAKDNFCFIHSEILLSSEKNAHDIDVE